MARSSFEGRTWGIPGSIPRGNNAWPVRMPLRTSRISRPPLVGRKPVRKQKKKRHVFALNHCQKDFSSLSLFLHLLIYYLESSFILHSLSYASICYIYTFGVLFNCCNSYLYWVRY